MRMQMRTRVWLKCICLASTHANPDSSLVAYIFVSQNTATYCLIDCGLKTSFFSIRGLKTSWIVTFYYGLDKKLLASYLNDIRVSLPILLWCFVINLLLPPLQINCLNFVYIRMYTCLQTKLRQLIWNARSNQLRFCSAMAVSNKFCQHISSFFVLWMKTSVYLDREKHGVTILL
jgi:hypothetical protein